MEDLDRQIAEACARLAPRLGPAPIVAVACIRDEQDVVERFVRHNLSVVDALVVVNHRSRDATPAILDALMAEGLPLAVCHASLPGKHQADWMSRMARAVAHRLSAHPVVPLDADEFLTGSDPETMRGLLRAIPRDAVAALEWLSYVPMPADPPDEVDILKRVTHRRAREVSRTLKLAAGGDLAADAGFLWSHGSHRATLALRDLDHLPQRRDLSLAHFPVRSVDQLRAKVANSRLSNAVRTGRADYLCYDWLENLVPLVPHMTSDDLRKAAANYLCERDFGDDEVVADPIIPLGGALCHTTGQVPDALERVMWNAMDLALLCSVRPDLTLPAVPDPAIQERSLAMRGALDRLRDPTVGGEASPDALVSAFIARRPAISEIPARTLARELLWRIRRRLRSMLGLTRTTS
ncbi:glycosyltransferase family 2 protein [Phreatobacter sp.]|uniref:glycosyltransferase family 2 protein n=1 Tax=Phreatobacter sp. TaxID=1966341 RepID=UPI0022BEDAA2|nr:glycosyltransferase family 2 protein [Phreatobacter sp.]MCZ8315637.1 glycosyltransferase family 2 protein [Phreatobacter sp.]